MPITGASSKNAIIFRVKAKIVAKAENGRQSKQSRKVKIPSGNIMIKANHDDSHGKCPKFSEVKSDSKFMTAMTIKIFQFLFMVVSSKSDSPAREIMEMLCSTTGYKCLEILNQHLESVTFLLSLEHENYTVSTKT